MNTTDPLTGEVVPLAPPDAPRALRIVGDAHEIALSRGTTRFVLGSQRDAVDCHVPRKHVSRRHAVIERDGAWLTIEDRSRTGCYLDGARVDRCHVRAGDVFVVGETPILVLDSSLMILRERLSWQLGYAAHAEVDAALVAVGGAKQPAIVLTGPRGFAPEMLAREIHKHTSRRDRPFVAIDGRMAKRVAQEIERAKNGTVFVDVRQVRRPAAALLRGRTDSPARWIVAASSERAAREALELRGLIEEIATPAVASRRADIVAMLDAALVTLQSDHRVTTDGLLCNLLGERVSALTAFGWPDNHEDLLRTAARLAAWGDTGTLLGAAAKLGIHVSTLREAFKRIGIVP